MGIKYTSFNVWVRYFVRNFKGYLWNSTQNMLPIHWKIRFLCNIEILRALRYKSSYAFLKRPPRCNYTHTDCITYEKMNQVSCLKHKLINTHDETYHRIQQLIQNTIRTSLRSLTNTSQLNGTEKWSYLQTHCSQLSHSSFYQILSFADVMLCQCCRLSWKSQPNSQRSRC